MIWPAAQVPAVFEVIREVRSVVSARPEPESAWKFWAKPHDVPLPPIKATGTARVASIV
jgi:hypothetical protein